MNAGDQQIIEGIVLSASGQATVAPALSAVLFDLAIALEQSTNLPVDVEHIIAAVVMAARKGQLSVESQLNSEDQLLQQKLVPHIKAVFEVFGGQVCEDD